jgi:hypothetical protein
MSPHKLLSATEEMANRDRKKLNYFGARPKSRQMVRDLLSSRRFSEAPFVNRRQPENNIIYCNELIKYYIPHQYSSSAYGRRRTTS